MSTESFNQEAFVNSLRRLPFRDYRKIETAQQQLARQGHILTAVVDKNPLPFAKITVDISVFTENKSNTLQFDIEFPNDYPRTRPKVILNYNKFLFFITPGHSNVTPAGELQIAYLTAWSPNSSIDSLIRNIRECFNTNAKWPLTEIDPHKRDLLSQLTKKQAADNQLVKDSYIKEISQLRQFVYISASFYYLISLSNRMETNLEQALTLADLAKTDYQREIVYTLFLLLLSFYLFIYFPLLHHHCIRSLSQNENTLRVDCIGTLGQKTHTGCRIPKVERFVRSWRFLKTRRNRIIADPGETMNIAPDTSIPSAQSYGQRGYVYEVFPAERTPFRYELLQTSHFVGK